MKDKDVILIEGKIGSLLKGLAYKSVYELLSLLEDSINKIMDSLLKKIDDSLKDDDTKNKRVKILLKKAEFHKSEFIKLMNQIKSIIR